VESQSLSANEYIRELALAHAFPSKALFEDTRQQSRD